MIEATYESFLRSPVGHFTITGSSFVWCASPALCGAVLWGQQTEAETRAILRIFDQYDRHMQATFDILLDSRGVEAVDPGCLGLLFSWLMTSKDGLVDRIGMQASVIREGPIGFLLTGLLPVVGRTHPYRIFTDVAEAFGAVAEAAPGLCAEVESIAERTRGVPRELGLMRAALEANVEASLEQISRTLGVSPRSLQRILTRYGTSFHQEVTNARFTLAQTLLRSSDQKLAVISARVGISERSLTLLFRARTGLTPARWRQQHRP
jgi:AraC-like DNA-binding protein